MYVGLSITKMRASQPGVFIKTIKQNGEKAFGLRTFISKYFFKSQGLNDLRELTRLGSARLAVPQFP